MKNYLFFLFLIAIGLAACEKDVSFNVPDEKPKLVVEGHIDVGSPPYLLLTRSSNYYGSTDLGAISNLFVHNATVRVFDGIDTVTLHEISFDSAGITISVYTDTSIFSNPANAMLGQENHTYQLWITDGNETVTSVTTIPTSIPLDSIWVQTNVKENRPDLVRLMVRYTDPPNIGQFVRYFTKRNKEVFKPGFNSVFDDQLINGTSFDFPLDRGQLQSDTAGFDEYGYFRRGDTITVQWININKDQYDFWRTLEYEINQGGPYSSPVKVQGNINGGLGIWGGYNSNYKTVIAPE